MAAPLLLEERAQAVDTELRAWQRQRGEVERRIAFLVGQQQLLAELIEERDAATDAVSQEAVAADAPGPVPLQRKREA